MSDPVTQPKQDPKGTPKHRPRKPKQMKTKSIKEMINMMKKPKTVKVPSQEKSQVKDPNKHPTQETESSQSNKLKK